MKDGMIRVDHYGKHRLAVMSPLAKACEEAFADADYCLLCDAHPSSGHKRECPIVQDCLRNGAEMRPEPEEA